MPVNSFFLMTIEEKLKKLVKPGYIYRRVDFTRYSDSGDNVLKALIRSGLLKQVTRGLYYCPKVTEFGEVYPNEHLLLEAFLRTRDFLVISPNSYNSLGLGLTQIYNFQWVINKKREGEFEFLGRKFRFLKHRSYPKKASPEFLLIDLLNNAKVLAVDESDLEARVGEKFSKFDRKKLASAAKRFGSAKTKKLISGLLNVPK